VEAPRPVRPAVGRAAAERLASPTYRIRVGDYRVVFAVDDTQRIVTIGHRREVYRR